MTDHTLFEIHKLTHKNIQVAVRDDGVVFHRTEYIYRGSYCKGTWTPFEAGDVEVAFQNGNLEIKYPCGSVDVAVRANGSFRLPRGHYETTEWRPIQIATPVMETA